jgi:hypothetical protein
MGPGWGSPRGVSTFEKVSLAFGAARLRQPARLLRCCGFENGKRGRVLPTAMFVPEATTKHAEPNIRAGDNCLLGPSLPASLDSLGPLSFPRDLKHVSTTKTTQECRITTRRKQGRAETRPSIVGAHSISPTKYEHQKTCNTRQIRLSSLSGA